MTTTLEEKREREREREETMTAATVWKQDEIDSLKADYEELKHIQNDAVTKFNPTPGKRRNTHTLDALHHEYGCMGRKEATHVTPRFTSFLLTPRFSLACVLLGTGRTGYMPIPPNNYPFYKEEEKYVPVVQPDGGQLSDWKPLYQPSKEVEEEDRRKAYESGVPHGYVPRGFKYEGMPTITLKITSELHTDDEYGTNIDRNGKHSGGSFAVEVSPKMTIEDLRLVIKVSVVVSLRVFFLFYIKYKICLQIKSNYQEKGGIIPGMQKLAYAGKKLDDPKRTLEQ